MRGIAISVTLMSLVFCSQPSSEQDNKLQVTPDTPQVNLRLLLGKVPENSRAPSGIQVLSETGGADLNKYLQTVQNDIRRNWYAVIPEEARAPQKEQGKVSIEFRIMPDGHMEGIKYSASSADDALDRAAYSGVTASNPLPPLPPDLKSPYLLLRFNFSYNPPESSEASTDRIASVTSPILAAATQKPNPYTSTVAILTDTQSVDFSAYLSERVLPKVQKSWYFLIPDSARPPQTKQGEVSVQFRILKEGYLQGLTYASSSGDGALDRAAWWAVEDSKPFPPLPTEFKGSYVELRVNFSYNVAKPGGDSATSGGTTSKRSASPDIGNSNVALASIGGGIVAPKAIFSPNPKYEERARKAGEQGHVILQIVVTKDGTPRDLTVVKSLSPELDKKAIETVQAWRFAPAMKDGQPVAVRINVDVDFKLY